MLGAWRIQFLDPGFGDIQLFIFVLTVAIITVKPKVSWVLTATTLVLWIPELLRFLPFPSSMFAHLRMLTYAVALVVLVQRLAGKYTDTKRVV